MIDKSLEGYNVTLFAYGHTGAGKTFTIFGESKSKVRGVVELITDRLSEKLLNLNEWAMKFSFVEIYNDQIRDLICPSTNPSQIQVREMRKGVMGLYGAKEVEIANTSQLQQLSPYIETANKNRAVGGTNANAQSSRSHCIITFNLQFKNQQGKAVYSKLNVIDLAGSERASETGAQGERLREGNNINNSLMILSELISSLEKGQRCQRYRESKLTHYLVDSIGGNSYLMLIACVSNDHGDESLRTIDFARRVKNIKPAKLEVNQSFSGGSELYQQQAVELVELRNKVTRLEAIIAQKYECQEKILNYINSPLDPSADSQS